MTNADLIERLRSQPFVTEEDARLTCRALGGAFGLGDAASTQGGGGLVVIDWHGKPIVGKCHLGAVLAQLVEDRATSAPSPVQAAS
jgi:hypothetical protein